MLASEQTNSSPVKKNSPFMETVQDKLKDIKNFSNWSAKEQMIAVSAVGMIFGAALPILVAALPVAVTGAIVALTLFFAVKAVEYTFKGLKWSAEKTVEGAKYTAGKIRDGAVHAKDKVGEGVDSLKKRFKERDRVVFYNHAKEGAAIEKMTKFPEKDRKKAGEIKHELKAIFADKGDNSKLVKNILSGISLKIDLKIAEEAKSESREHTPKWQVQKDFIKHLGEKDLRVLIKQKALPSDVYFIDRVFSEHYDEIKEVIAKCKEDHILKRSLKMRNNMFEEGSARPSRSFSLPSFSSLGRKGSERSDSVSKSSSMDSVRTESTATVSDSDSQDFATVNPNLLRRSSSSSSLTSKLTPVAPPKVPESPSIDSGMGSGSSTPTSSLGKLKQSSNKDELGAMIGKNLEEFTSSARTGIHNSLSNRDSGFSSPTSSTPKKLNLSSDDLSEARSQLNRTGSLDKLVLPSAKVDLETDVQQHAATQKATVSNT